MRVRYIHLHVCVCVTVSIVANTKCALTPVEVNSKSNQKKIANSIKQLKKKKRNRESLVASFHGQLDVHLLTTMLVTSMRNTSRSKYISESLHKILLLISLSINQLMYEAYINSVGRTITALSISTRRFVVKDSTNLPSLNRPSLVKPTCASARADLSLLSRELSSSQF